MQDWTKSTCCTCLVSSSPQLLPCIKHHLIHHSRIYGLALALLCAQQRLALACLAFLFSLDTRVRSVDLITLTQSGIPAIFHLDNLQTHPISPSHLGSLLLITFAALLLVDVSTRRGSTEGRNDRLTLLLPLSTDSLQPLPRIIIDIAAGLVAFVRPPLSASSTRPPDQRRLSPSTHIQSLVSLTRHLPSQHYSQRAFQ